MCGSSKVAPRNATSIPGLELCVALEVARATSRFTEAFAGKINVLSMYTNSQVVLGYLRNTEKKIRKICRAKSGFNPRQNQK